ncbi:MAG: RnfABCDGE type electron transport complex subunit B [Casimicrobiaceae bacterium]
MSRLHDPDLARRIDALLPQTQCRRCGEPGCLPYAEAIAAGRAPINRCPPGGDATIAALASLLRIAAAPLDITRGTAGPLRIAAIDEATCIGCTLCIQACPTDAIVGAARQMHTVLSHRCTGCELCLPPCPVDCIDLLPAGRDWTRDDARNAGVWHASLRARQARMPPPLPEPLARPDSVAQRKAALAAALVRARERRRSVKPAER